MSAMLLFGTVAEQFPNKGLISLYHSVPLVSLQPQKFARSSGCFTDWRELKVRRDNRLP